MIMALLGDLVCIIQYVDKTLFELSLVCEEHIRRRA